PGSAGTFNNIRIAVSDGQSTDALPTFSITVNAAAAQTGSVSLSWTAPVSRADGSALALSEISGYTVYYGTSSGNHPNSLIINDGSATSATINNLPLGTYYLVVTTLDSGGRESSHSSEALAVMN
ncbi:MAG: fibronectin type III domain-containing protein, partial [Thiogranum sp.]